MEYDTFYINNNMTMTLEQIIDRCKDFDEFEKRFSEELLSDNCQIGNYLRELLYKYDKTASGVSFDAHLAHSYVGNICNYKKNNPSRDALINICIVIGTTVQEVNYLLKYAGHSPLYARRKRDVIIWFGIMKHESIETINQNIIERDLKPLYKED